MSSCALAGTAKKQRSEMGMECLSTPSAQRQVTVWRGCWHVSTRLLKLALSVVWHVITRSTCRLQGSLCIDLAFRITCCLH